MRYVDGPGLYQGYFADGNHVDPTGRGLSLPTGCVVTGYHLEFTELGRELIKKRYSYFYFDLFITIANSQDDAQLPIVPRYHTLTRYREFRVKKKRDVYADICCKVTAKKTWQFSKHVGSSTVFHTTTVKDSKTISAFAYQGHATD